MRLQRHRMTRCAKDMLLVAFGLVLVVMGVGSAGSNASILKIQSSFGGPRFSVRVDSPSELQFRGVVRAELDTSCAAACIATVLTHDFSEPVTEQEALTGLFAQRLRIAPGSPTNFSLLDVKNVLDRRGYLTSGFKGTAESVHAQSLFPSILLLDIGNHPHFTVLKAMGDQEVFLADPIFGNVAVEMSEFERRWNGVLLAFDELSEDRQSNNQSSDIILDIRPPDNPNYASVNRILGTGFRTDMSNPEEF